MAPAPESTVVLSPFCIHELEEQPQNPRKAGLMMGNRKATVPQSPGRAENLASPGSR
ncbi:hypothetical protein HHK36_021086 [Tetracentron sinense]|uniref:Uncharacterized protein n=1 Tax=Tetracentron sinense TaxID=13715 RepID=A0A834YQV9_TETSI|nr:hypothetical protein HHK36_021086 [Tetracentron sinense]